MDLSSLGLDTMSAVLLTLFVMGIVECAKAAYNREWYQFTVILASGVAGLIAGLFLGVGIFTGICAGFAASGAITLAQNIGKN